MASTSSPLSLPPDHRSLASTTVHSPGPNHPLVPLLECCKTIKEFKQIHSQMIRTGLANSPIEQRRMLSFCCSSESGDMDYARLLFSKITELDIFLWNTMIKGFSNHNRPESAVRVYIEMLERGFEPNDYTFPFLLKSFTRDTVIVCGDQLHAQALKFGFASNAFAQNALIRMYARSGDTDTARELFDRTMSQDYTVVWNDMISGYNKSKQYEESCKLFIDMEKKNVKPNSVTYVSLLSACAKLKDLDFGTRVHRMIDDSRISASPSLENALLDMYAVCGEMNMAWRLFKNMKAKDAVSWTTVVAGFANSGQVDHARALFDEMPERDPLLLATMIHGYVKLSRFKDALDIFREMQAAKIRPDESTITSVLMACAQLGALGVGEWLRAYMDHNKIKMDVFMENALIDMYSKCGCVESAVEIFQKMQRRDKFTWTAMITGFTVNGHGEEALDLFSEMLRTCTKPDEITYVGILSACTHAGLVEEGREFFSRMITTDGIMPDVTHYGCLVDLLARAGHLQEALQTIDNMPMRPDWTVWGALLGGCRVYRDVETAESAAKHLLELEPDSSAVYVLLSNIYAKCGKWEEVHKVRKLMMDRGTKKVSGCSVIEVDGLVHEFFSGDISHPRSNEIYSKLEEMCKEMRDAGFVPDVSGVFPELGEEERENAVYRHSEKLAIAFGFFSLEPGMTVRVAKNLRMCFDCHNEIKFMSRVYRREVVVRDRTRVHHFRHGLCSCKEYW